MSQKEPRPYMLKHLQALFGVSMLIQVDISQAFIVIESLIPCFQRCDAEFILEHIIDFIVVIIPRSKALHVIIEYRLY